MTSKTLTGQAAREAHDGQRGSGGCDPSNMLDWDAIAAAAIEAAKQSGDACPFADPPDKHCNIKTCDHCPHTTPPTKDEREHYFAPSPLLTLSTALDAGYVRVSSEFLEGVFAANERLHGQVEVMKASLEGFALRDAKRECPNCEPCPDHHEPTQRRARELEGALKGEQCTARPGERCWCATCDGRQH